MQIKNFLRPHLETTFGSCALFLLRIFIGVAFILHGWGKIKTPFAWMGANSSVPDVLQFLAALSEFGGGILLILGLFTRFAALCLACTMLVAVYFHLMIMHDPFVSTSGSSYELALIYFGVSLVYLSLGAGKISFDKALFGEMQSSKSKSKK